MSSDTPSNSLDTRIVTRNFGDSGLFGILDLCFDGSLELPLDSDESVEVRGRDPEDPNNARRISSSLRSACIGISLKIMLLELMLPSSQRDSVVLGIRKSFFAVAF